LRTFLNAYWFFFRKIDEVEIGSSIIPKQITNNIKQELNNLHDGCSSYKFAMENSKVEWLVLKPYKTVHGIKSKKGEVRQ